MRKEQRPLRALLVEDSEPDAMLLLDALRQGGFEISSERVDAESKLREALKKTWDVVFCDYQLPQFDGPRAIQILRGSGLDLPVIVVSGTINEEAIVEMLRLGANDYVMKDKLSRLVPSVERELRDCSLRQVQRSADASRRSAEAALEEANERFQLVQRATKDAIWDWNAQTDTLWLNDSFFQVFGYERADIHGGRDFRTAHIHRDDLEEVLGKFDELFEGPADTLELEYRFERKDGRYATVQDRCFVTRDERGHVLRAVGSISDITERKKLETQFLRAQRLESIGTLAGGIAHDLNNVLGPIIMAVDLFKLKFTAKTDLELLETVDVSARRGAEMVRQVLSFARGIEGRRLAVRPTQLLKEVAKIARETFPKSITVHTTASEDIWIVPGDATQLHQVLLNLCVNARDAMPAGGRLTLSARNMEIDAQFAAMHPGARPGTYVLITVSDTGVGMQPEVLEKIFEPFFTTKELEKGTGLGLSTTLTIVESHGGFITAESEVNRGTVFKLFLPASGPDQLPGTGGDSSESIRGNGETILVIDDESSVRVITRQTLEAFGYQVIVASDGAEGVAVYARRGKEIAAVITDMMMPVMDGAATIRALMRLNPEVRIIAASGLVSKGAEAEAAGAGVKQFLPKPYTASTMLQTLHAVLHPAADKAD